MGEYLILGWFYVTWGRGGILPGPLWRSGETRGFRVAVVMIWTLYIHICIHIYIYRCIVIVLGEVIVMVLGIVV